ncbi:MAG: ABC transporter substrate-binding protein [Pseudomonadota bacterium]
MLTNLKQLFCVLILLLTYSSALLAHHAPINVAVVSPDTDVNNFWRVVHNFARASAVDLDINLKIHTRKENNFSYIDSLRSAFETDPPPDIVLAIFYKKLLKQTLGMADEYEIPIFMFNTFVTENENNDFYIRKTYKSFLGHMHPDEKSAGYKLAKHLIRAQKEKRPNEIINVVGISGHRNSYVTQQRNLGLEKAVREEGAVLYQVVNANWSSEVSYNQAAVLMDRYPDLDVIWAASDLMAISSGRAIKDKKMDEILTGGIDWTKEGVEKIKSGEISASVGGHFSEIGFALVLIHDYFHGVDFYDELGGEITTEMSLLTYDNLNKYHDFIIRQDWNRVDFTRYSKVLNPSINAYDFSFASLIDNFHASH